MKEAVDIIVTLKGNNRINYECEYFDYKFIGECLELTQIKKIPHWDHWKTYIYPLSAIKEIEIRKEETGKIDMNEILIGEKKSDERR